MATQVSETSGKSRARGAADELAVIAQRAQAFTNASGTAIALSEGNADEIVCRARSGASAPEVGTALRVEGSFTGLCIQSGKELRCDDAETDTRVDTAAIRALGIRSMVVTPIKEDNRVVGILAVFAPTPHAFTITHVAVLKTMADQIAVLLQKERRAREGGGKEPEPAPATPPVTLPKPVAAVPVVPPAVVVKPATPAPRASFPVVSRVEPIKASPAAEEAAITLPLPRKEERRAEQKEHRAAPSSLESLAGEEKKASNRNMIAAVVAGVVILGGGTFGYLKMRKPAAPPPHQETAVLPASTQPNVPAGATTGSQPAVTAPGNPAAGGSAIAPAPAASAPAHTAPDTSAADAAKRAAAERAAARNNNNNNSNNTPPQPEKHAPAAVELSSGSSKIGSQGASQPPADVAPVLMVNNNASALPNLTRPVAASTPTNVTTVSHSDLEPAQVVKRVAPVYPTIARGRRLTGSVTVQGLVEPDGKITNLQLVSGLPVFKDAAFDAIKQFQFKPARLNGQSIEQAIQIRFDFKPN